MPRRRALIIGGALGGLFAAQLLRAAGWDVEVYERIGDDLAGRGAGLGTHDALRDMMARVGIDVVTPLGVATRAYVCRDNTGRAVHEIKLERVMSAWARLYRPLRDALPDANYHPGMTLARVETDARGATAVFADGTRISADLLVGADGGRSTVRTQFLPDVKPEYAGYIAWRARPRGRHDAGRARGAVRAPHLLRSRRRAVDLVSGAGARRRHPARSARLQHRLVPPDQRTAARRHQHRREWIPPRAGAAAADPSRGDGRREGGRAGALAARGRRRVRRRRAAVLPGDLRSRLAALGVRARGAAGRRRLRGEAARGRRRDQGGARRRLPCRRQRGDARPRRGARLLRSRTAAAR